MNCQYHPFQGSTIYVVVNKKKAVPIFTENYSEYSRKTYAKFMWMVWVKHAVKCIKQTECVGINKE